MGKKGGAPKPDKRIGEAALKGAALGEDYLAWMKDQAKITNRWATEDRDRYQTTFQPMEDRFIAEAQGYDTPARQAGAARAAVADTRQQQAIAEAGRHRSLTAMGVDPRSGRYQETGSRAGIQAALGAAGAATAARERTRATGRSLRASAVNLGKGLAVNPATSIGIANGAMSSGFSGAMQGNSALINTLQGQDALKMRAHEAEMDAWGGLAGAAGTAVGLWSSKSLKTNRKPVQRSLLAAVRRMPVEEWDYKPGVADGGRHVGPYAEDFARETGRGDGRTIDVVDAIGTTMGAIKELDAKVTKLGRSLPRAA